MGRKAVDRLSTLLLAYVIKVNIPLGKFKGKLQKDFYVAEKAEISAPHKGCF
jgi:hypothetical protein